MIEDKNIKSNIINIIRWILLVPAILTVLIICYTVVEATGLKTSLGDILIIYFTLIFSILLAPSKKLLIATIITTIYLLLSIIGIISSNTQINTGVIYELLLLITLIISFKTKKYSRWLTFFFGFCSGILGITIIGIITYLLYKIFPNEFKDFKDFEYIEKVQKVEEKGTTKVIKKKKRTCLDVIKLRYKLHQRRIRQHQNLKSVNKSINKEEKKVELATKIKGINIMPKLNNNITLILVVLICAFAYIYVENGKISYKEKIRIQQELEENNQKIKLDSCLNDARNDYEYNWNKICKNQGKKNDCLLPSYNANQVEKWRTEAKKQCMDKFKNNAF